MQLENLWRGECLLKAMRAENGALCPHGCASSAFPAKASAVPWREAMDRKRSATRFEELRFIEAVQFDVQACHPSDINL
ncbi:hypothetical protein [Azospirillum himalayense]|uniref:Uncharacterized protein n=1 Tax=Azospirillum himalayense TaxID=654847 RepID=A0ABW0G7V1_9PROT